MRISILIVLLLSGGFAMAGDYRSEIDAWHEKRVSRLTSPEGWLSLAGLFWLAPGDNSFGSGDDNALVFPAKAPKKLGKLVVTGEQVTLVAEPGAGLTSGGKPVGTLVLQSDKSGAPTRVDVGSFSFFVIERSGRLGVRLRDSEAEARKGFLGIERYPVDAAYRVTARFVPYTPVKTIEVPNVLGTIEASPSPGALVFALEGQELRLDAVDDGGEELFVIFADKTNGKETYGPGRFVYVPRPKEGKTTLDFNKAYNPPCAFTPFATCPLPPPQNKLPLRIQAGEKKYAGH